MGSDRSLDSAVQISHVRSVTSEAETQAGEGKNGALGSALVKRLRRTHALLKLERHEGYAALHGVFRGAT